MLSLVIGAGVYGLGLARLWGSAGVGRGVRAWQAALFGLGIVALVVALVSPLDALGSALFSAHMLQHVLLLLIAPPLLLLGAPSLAVLWALPPAWRRGVGGWWRGAAGWRTVWLALSAPLLVWVLNTAAMWLWHYPALYEWALRDGSVHAFEHACFFLTALLFWWALPLVGSPGTRLRTRLGYGGAVAYLFAAAVQSMVLGIAITFSPLPWYPAYRPFVAAWGLTPIEDQQLAGLIMWVPVGVIYSLAALALLLVWLGLADPGGRPGESRT